MGRSSFASNAGVSSNAAMKGEHEPRNETGTNAEWVKAVCGHMREAVSRVRAYVAQDECHRKARQWEVRTFTCYAEHVMQLPCRGALC
jgi:hypothetical protein